MAQDSVKALTLSIIESASITLEFQPINAPGFSYPVFAIRIVNNSTEDIVVSYDGINEHEYVPKMTQFTFPSQTNSVPNNKIALFSAYTQIYVKGIDGTGEVTLSGYYL